MSEYTKDDVEFTKDEISAIRSLRRAFKKCPSSLRLYSTGDELLICKAGVGSDTLNEKIIESGLNVGVFLSNIHEEQENGENNSPIRV